MDISNPLTGHDYLNLPITELSKHPDFDAEAFKTIAFFMEATTSQLVEFNKQIMRANAA